VFGHIDKDNKTCDRNRDIWYVSEETVQEKIRSFTDKVTGLEKDLEEAKSNLAKAESNLAEAQSNLAEAQSNLDELEQTATDAREAEILSLRAELSGLNISEEQITEAVVKKVVAILDDGLAKMSQAEMEQEYLYRKKANITYAQFREYSRWNRHIKKQRSSPGRFFFTVNGKEYSIRKTGVEIKHDAATRRRLLLAMYALDFPKAERLETEKKVDGIVVDSVTKAMKARLEIALRLKATIRAKRFHHFDGRLLYAINWDGAPFNKTGALTNQSVLLAACLNEGFTTTLESLIFLGVISSSEDSEESKKLCRNIDKKLQSFKKLVEEEGIIIEGLRFTSVEYVLACDMKAANKLQGAGSHASTFFSTSHIGLTKDSVGYGVNGRSKKEEVLFKDFHRKADDTEQKWKPGELPIPITPSSMSKLKKDLKVRMGRGRYGDIDTLDGKDLKKWTEAAKKIAKNAGHGFFNAEFFPETDFVTATYCALHYKTVKVLDFLDLSCMALMNYDRYCGRLETMGASLGHFINSLENDKVMKSQLNSYASDARMFWLKLDLKKSLCHSGTGLRKLNKLVEKMIKPSRLLGRQANIPLSALHKFGELLHEARENGNFNDRQKVSKKSEAEINKDMDQVISALLALLLAIRNVTYWMGRSGFEIYGQDKNASEEDYKAYVRDCNKQLKKAAMELELIQTSLFPEYVRPYDVCATYSMPHISTILAEKGILLGRAGLLECYESFHKYYASLSAFKSAVSTSKYESSNMYKFSTMWLIYAFLPMQPYGIAKEVRASKGWKFRSQIIPEEKYPFFNKNDGCF
jgi:hypothetical protein